MPELRPTADPGRRHLLCVTYPAFGHVLPILPIAAELVRRGHRVTVATGDRFADRVAGIGAEPLTYTTSLTDEAPPECLGADELAWRTCVHIEEMLAVSPVVASCDRPDAVVYDTTLWAPPRVLAERWGVEPVQVVPTFASNEYFSVAEQLSRVAPPIDPGHPAIVRIGELLTTYATDHGVPAERVADVLAGVGRTSVVTIPRAFQVHGETFGDDHVFVGPCTGPDDDASDAWQRPDTGPVGLISLGTTVNERPDLFRRCAEAFGGTRWRIVMTVGGRLDPDSIGPLPGNVEVHRWLPHAAVLRHAAVFVCQGGMGSVQESLQYGVPMVVAPHHHEQRANAEHITALGLGTMLEHATLTASGVRDAVERVATDPGIARRAAAMREEIHAAGGAARAADVVEAVAGRTTGAAFATA